MDMGQMRAMVDRMNRQLAAEGKGPFQWKTVPQGAATSVWAGAVAPADEVGGRYCENCKVGQIVADDAIIRWMRTTQSHCGRKVRKWWESRLAKRVSARQTSFGPRT